MLFFIKKIKHHTFSRVSYLVYLTIFLLPNRHKVLDRKHSNNFQVKLSGAAFLPWGFVCLCLFVVFGGVFFFFFFGWLVGVGGIFLKIVVFLNERLTD